MRTYIPSLSNRERQVLMLASEGLSSHQIAERLRLSPETVKDFKRNAQQKLHTRNGTHTVAEAIRKGLILPPAPKDSA